MEVEDDRKDQSLRTVKSLLTETRMSKLTSAQFRGLGRKAIMDFGMHLYSAMSLSEKQQQSQWRAALQKWDYEENDDAGPHSDSLKVGNILLLLRQQLIAWAAFGHGACAAEAGARAVEEVSPFGTMSQTNDPWVGFSNSNKDTHPMLLELKRTLTGASGLLAVLSLEMRDKLAQRDTYENEICIVGACLADILEGQSWILTAKAAKLNQSSAAAALWSEVSALTASMPCHVARDGVLLQRCEARATAAAMWALKGTGSMSRLKDEAPTPLAINRLLEAGLAPMPRGWGTLNPYVGVNSYNEKIDELRTPFRPAVASSYLYKPLLVWDLYSLAGAVFTSVLATDVMFLPTSAELLNITQVLLVGRLVQAIATPTGIDLSGAYEVDDEPCWTAAEMQSEGESLSKLVAYCRCMIRKKSLESSPDMSETTDDPPEHLLSVLGLAILPFARALILMLRAASAVVRERKSKLYGKASVTCNLLESIICNQELMTSEDGFHLLKEIKGPTPSSLIDLSGTWKDLIDCWLISAIGFEMHHGSVGRSSLPMAGSSTLAPLHKQQPDVQPDAADKTLAAALTNGNMDVDSADQNVSLIRGTIDILMDEDDDDSHFIVAHGDAEDMDSEEEMIPIPFVRRNLGIVPGPTVSSIDSAESEDNSSSGSEDDIVESDRDFAHVSRSPILPYQPCTLGVENIGPGRQGAMFEFAAASAVMSDLSHLGLLHRKFTPTFSLIRLPKSFVELYNVVNKVKGRDNTSIMDESEGSSEIAICLLTGTVMRSGSSRRGFSRQTRPPGACTLHARKHGSGIGIFFLVQKCTVLLMHNNKSAYSPSVYVDEHGEEDQGLRRGRPLFLNDARYRALEQLWRLQGIPREVAQIRSTSDRVIRDNWY
jgi:hypothetical protein